MSTVQKAFISLVVAHGLGFVIMLAVGSQSPEVAGLPLTIWLFLAIYLVQWLAFIPSYLKQTEAFFDLIGGLTFITAAMTALLLAGTWQWHQLVAAGMVVVWAARLGLFLFRRIRREGKDGRFDVLKTHGVRFANVWSVQGLWVTLTSLAALIVIMSTETYAFSWIHFLGIFMWLTGFTIESMADEQKRRFRAVPENKGKFINVGLWSISRHPNYFGEILLWVGVAVFALPFLSGWQWLGLISPAFVFVLLNYISGVPLLEQRAEESWGNDADYLRYKARTPVLIPRLFLARSESMSS